MSTTSRKLILITNDDSISAPGIHRLVDAVGEQADVYVVAPAQPHSGQSAAITVGAPLHIQELESYNNARRYAVTGTPVDCVKLALNAILPRTPDLILAGINHGSNSAVNVTYSGTMGAVLEGCMLGIPSVGFSLLDHSMRADFSLSLPLVADIISDVLNHGLNTGTCLNINIPADITPKGARVCRAARGRWTDEYEHYTDPCGRPFYWLKGTFISSEPQATDTDDYWLEQGFISIVPVTPDQTIPGEIAPLSSRFDR